MEYEIKQAISFYHEVGKTGRLAQAMGFGLPPGTHIITGKVKNWAIAETRSTDLFREVFKLNGEDPTFPTFVKVASLEQVI